MELSDYDFSLPERLIAQEPLAERDGSRMLVVDRGNSSFRDDTFFSLPALLSENDVLVINNTKVLPARLIGRLETGARIELFLVEDLGNNCWSALARPARRLTPGKLVIFGDDFFAEIIAKRDDGQVIARLGANGPVIDAIEHYGRTPLPHYIRRGEEKSEDRSRYQTVYAEKRGAIAAPTAGLHFTPEIFSQIGSTGAEVVEITLHVGYGTFEPVRASDLRLHQVLPERYEISAKAAAALNAARARGGRIIAVGTTTTRALESNFGRHARFTAESALAELTVTPGYKFAAVDALLTNFHLPQSSLLILVSTFGGHELIMNAYRHAVTAEYRFYSYGDCMLVA